MRTTTLSMWAVLAVLIAGCGSYSAPPVQLAGDPASMGALRGTWHGTFRNTQLRRRGQVDFRMKADADSAFGEVVMYTDSPSQPIWNRPTTGPSGTHEVSTWLRIRFVRVEGGLVSGEMEPFFEPRCQCYTTARFVGRLHGTKIDGSYTTRSADGRFESSGSWEAERTAETAP